MSDAEDWRLSLSLFRVEKEGSLNADELKALQTLADERKTPISLRAFKAVLSSHQRLLEKR